MKLHLEITVDYTLNGVTEEALAGLLRRAAWRIFNEGEMTGNTSAEVKAWSYNVTRAVEELPAYPAGRWTSK